MFNRGSSAYKSGQLQSSAPGGGGGNPSRQQHPMSLCADCGATGPSWASVNRGVLLCSECTSVHRSLGRHISHVKSLRSQWIPEQLTMVQSLYSCGANSIWEYSLINPGSGGGGSSGKGGGGGRRKPSYADPLHPIKSDFIAAKYRDVSFVYKPAKDEPAVTQSDLSKQLHSSVRTPNLETSLRLISQGADPNYYHPEKNSTPLQVAARAGQSGQVELLLVYGADPGAVDKMGRTASEYAKQAGHSGLASRIAVSQYELSDRLTYFLCQKKPDHSGGQHFLLPEVEHDKEAADRKVAKRKLQGLNNSVFEELSMDVYDEVDRRETDAIWSSLETSSSSKLVTVVPFLPVNPEYGTTRNQGRQKLARLNAREFAILVMDVLKEMRRRQAEMNSKWPAKMPSPLRETPGGLTRKVGQTKSLPVQQRLAALSSNLSDDEPIYDHVASDDDYYHLPEVAEEKRRPQSSTANSSSINSSPAKSSKSNSSNSNNINSIAAIGPTEFRELRAQLDSSEMKVQRLIESNDDMRGEISRLSATVSKLVSENEHLRHTIISPSHQQHPHHHHSSSASQLIRGVGEALPYADGGRYSPATAASSGPYSLPVSSSSPAAAVGGYKTLPSNRTFSPAAAARNQQQSQSHYYEPYDYPSSNNSDQQNSLPQLQKPVVQMQHHEYADPRELVNDDPHQQPLLPSQEEVVRRTEAITRCIQELLISAKDEKFDAFIPCSERIVRAVTDMVVLFPEEPADPAVSASLSSLTAAAAHFETECRILIVRSQTEPLNQSFVTQQVIQCAFDIAKSTKQLVALFQ